MPLSSFPTTLADLNFDDPDSISFYRSIKDIRKSTLSIPNRLTSILHDAKFVQQIAQAYRLPPIANERCGSWYIDPALKPGSAYFKSTDGHHGQWNFSLRRLNLHVLSIIGQHGGAIIVDSTRRGKNMPDAFLKTVPVWVAVLNRALFPDRTDSHALQCPPAPDELGASERSQIESRLPGFVQAFRSLCLDVEAIRETATKPLQIVWKVHDIDSFHQDLISPVKRVSDFHLLVLCSASRRILRAEVSAGGYIQGAGDDSEGWSYGLTPQLFWEHKDYLLNHVSEEDLPDTIQRLLSQQITRTDSDDPLLIHPTAGLFIGKAPGESPDDSCQTDFDLEIHCGGPPGFGKPTVLHLACRSGKLGSRDLRERLHIVKDHAAYMFSRQAAPCVLVTCETGKDLSVGVALLLLCLFYNDDGTPNQVARDEGVTKSFIKKRLAWISSSMPQANPSRATLQSVNAFLMERP